MFYVKPNIYYVPSSYLNYFFTKNCSFNSVLLSNNFRLKINVFLFQMKRFSASIRKKIRKKLKMFVFVISPRSIFAIQRKFNQTMLSIIFSFLFFFHFGSFLCLNICIKNMYLVYLRIF